MTAGGRLQADLQLLAVGAVKTIDVGGGEDQSRGFAAEIVRLAFHRRGH